ncbi:hypothetical protein ALC56_07050 [Trachymyrmex septentrionalis]|uniref:Uncharacterized protein n=1 Tax=Trachymyrmex septentrionalis TaxID=34720 RepID=A0A195FED6_9HYME|nr:hypothetical protein ALC56_07050 [Trachymyrmex septentrionalis]
MSYRPSFAALTTKMFPRDLLLILLLTCILYRHSYAQEMKNNTSLDDRALDDWVIVSTIMVCSMFSVLFILIPTLLYYRYCSKEAEFAQ